MTRDCVPSSSFSRYIQPSPPLSPRGSEEPRPCPARGPALKASRALVGGVLGCLAPHRRPGPRFRGVWVTSSRSEPRCGVHRARGLVGTSSASPWERGVEYSYSCAECGKARLAGPGSRQCAEMKTSKSNGPPSLLPIQS